MITLRSAAANHPIVFVFASIVAWFLLLVVFTGIASTALGKPFGDVTSGLLGRLVTTFCVLVTIWRLRWLKSSGVARWGSWKIWLIALGSLIYFAAASLYSFYGNLAFDPLSLARLSASQAIVLTAFMVALCEEVLFRGAALHTLTRAWGKTRLGMIQAVAFIALLFAVLHVMQVFAGQLSLSAGLLLTLQTGIISIWWGALVLVGGSIWPAVMLHFVGNAVVPLQGLTASMVEPRILAYQRVFWFSIPLGALGIVMLGRALRRPIPTEEADPVSHESERRLVSAKDTKID